MINEPQRRLETLILYVTELTAFSSSPIDAVCHRPHREYCLMHHRTCLYYCSRISPQARNYAAYLQQSGRKSGECIECMQLEPQRRRRRTQYTDCSQQHEQRQLTAIISRPIIDSSLPRKPRYFKDETHYAVIRV